MAEQRTPGVCHGLGVGLAGALDPGGHPRVAGEPVGQQGLDVLAQARRPAALRGELEPRRDLSIQADRDPVLATDTRRPLGIRHTVMLYQHTRAAPGSRRADDAGSTPTTRSAQCVTLRWTSHAPR